MASLSCRAFIYHIRCSSNRDNHDPHKQKLNIKVNETSVSTTKVEVLSKTNEVAATFATVASPAETGHVTREQSRQDIPTKKQLVDPFRQGLIIEGGVGYRQTVVVRSYEVGPDKTATLESILCLLQETALNHVWMSGLLGDGFGATHGMMRNNLIWVVTRMQVQVDSYPICTWVMMNQQTRRLSKMPEEVTAEISPWFINKHAIQEDVPEKIVKLDNNAKYVNSNLKPKRSDLDMNHHVNNIKYVRWMLETIPDKVLESHQLSSIILEYRRECGSLDVVQSLCEPDEDGLLVDAIQENNDSNLLSGFSLASDIFEGHGLLGSFEKWPLRYTHLLQGSGEPKNEEIVRGRTTWKRKLSTMPFPT
ncbi:hypothetical protein HHK36_024592 [Tetracentron sinense]|uniref:Acyl-[acyl-carrier-protein] hydrolase n=1 Tax=Tetracentron sinense TaxID=13715 RepID=A0A834YNA6_TETSI|nr:hypothetical protein HHK36_024592 [Tetracentron sinense]